MAECCLPYDPDAEASLADLADAYRIWARPAGEGVYKAILEYCNNRFQVTCLQRPDGDNLVYGFRGVALRPV